MELSLKNIGKISAASVRIDGITVIAGENNTGKSTIGRALFATFNSFYNVQKQIESTRISSIESLLDRLYFESGSPPFRMVDARETAKAIVSEIGEHGIDSDIIKQEILGFLESYRAGITQKFEYNDVDKIIVRIKEVLEVPEREVLKSILEKRLGSEFNEQFSNVFQDNYGKITLKIKDKHISTLIENNEIFEVENAGNVSLRTEVIYIDDPFVLDQLGSGFYRNRIGYTNHREHLHNKLLMTGKTENLVDEIIAKEKFDSIYEKISSVCGGDIVRKRRTGMGYRQQNSDKVLNIRNLSTGLKTFVILKMLLTNGTIESNGAIILDEPEIHLHPEWQLLFAELIVLLQKEFGLHILLNTHSPYFLRAIQVYSAKYEIADICKYYLSEVKGDQASVIDVTKCIDKIYAKLSRPLQNLEDERWQDD